MPEAVAEFTVAEPAEAWLVSPSNYRSTVIEPAVAEPAEAWLVSPPNYRSTVIEPAEIFSKAPTNVYYRSYVGY